MARTPSLHALQRSALESQANDEPRITRGSFVAASASALLAPLLSSCGPSSVATGRERVAIVGAGLAGLTAALTLHDAGIASTVYESANRVGGRMHSERRYWNDGQHTEWCGAMIDTKHYHMHTLARRFGLRLIDTFAYMLPDARDTSFFAGRYYPMARADVDFAPVFRVLREQIAKMGPQPTYNRFNAYAREMDLLSAADWIERYVPGGSSSQMGRLIADAYWNEYGVDVAQQSALNIVYMLGVQPYGEDRTLNVLGYSDQRYTIAMGNQTLPERIAAALPSGSVKMGYRLQAIRTRPDGAYALDFTTSGGIQTIVADRVILAMSFMVLRGIDFSGAGFDSRKIRAINELGYGEHTKTHVQFHGRPWLHKGAWPDPVDGQIWTDAGFQCSVDFSLGQHGAAGIIEFFTTGPDALVDMPPSPYGYANSAPAVNRHVKRYLEQLETVWPGTTKYYNGKATVGNAQADPNILASYATWLRGQYTSIAGYERVRQHRVHFAGEHCSVEYQGFMEGAAQTGVLAAGEILADYGLRVRSAV